MREIIAHRRVTDGKEETEPLVNHLVRTAKRAAKLAEDVGLSKGAYLIGFLHDIGKADPAFQDYIYGAGKTGVTHSSAGAKYLFALGEKVGMGKTAYEKRLFETYRWMLGYAMMAHHGLFDALKREDGDFISVVETRLAYDEEGDYDYDAVVRFTREMAERTGTDLEALYLEGFSEWHKKMEIIEDLANEVLPLQKHQDGIGKIDRQNPLRAFAFYQGMLIRLYLAILRSADVRETIEAFDPVLREEDCRNDFVAAVETRYATFHGEDPLSCVRGKIAERILLRVDDAPGIYRLDLPTGAGKTLTALRYGMHRLEREKARRFFYVTAFLSVLEQNARVVRDILGDEGVLEHHSNVVDEKKPETEDGCEESIDALRTQYFLETWANPIVLTTMVQFMNTLFKETSAHNRRFLSLGKSVIILDEVQSLPLKVLSIGNLALNFLAYVMDVTVVLTTATQPPYDHAEIAYPIQYAEHPDLVVLSDEERSVFKRTSARLLSAGEIVGTDELIDAVRAKSDDSCLIVLNTKKAVRAVYERLSKEDPRPCYYLSTNLCAADRLSRIREMKEKLRKKEPILCVSTQLIEAGVDIDFDRLIRSFAGVDALVQASGRVNREGEKKLSEVSFANVGNLENLQHLPEIAEKRSFMMQALRQIEMKRMDGEIPMDALERAYFHCYYANAAARGSREGRRADYLVEKKAHCEEPFDTLVEALSTNPKLQKQSTGYKNDPIRQSFRSAGRCFALLDEDTTPVIVLHEDVRDRVEELLSYEGDYDPDHLRRAKEILRSLMPYTVSAYGDLKKRVEVESHFNERVWILADGCYTNTYGWDDPMEQTFVL